MMKITDIEVFKVSVPFKSAYAWASGTRKGTSRILVKVHTDSSIVGLGETFRLPFVDKVLEHLIPILIGENAHDFERIHRKMLAAGYYHHHRALVFAACAIEMALWDAVAKAAQVPLFKLLGGAYRQEIDCIAYLFTQEPDRLVAETKAFIAEGFSTIKIKIGTDPDLDVALVQRLREEVGYDIKLRVDLNQAWTVGTAKRLLKRLEPFDLEYVEQPLLQSALNDTAMLRAMFSTPIALDESAYTTYDVMEIVRQEAADVILVDPHEAGGILPCKKACAIAEAAGIPVNFHSASELGLSTAAYLHIAASTPNMLYAIDTQYQHLTDDVVTTPFKFIEGKLKLPEGFGLGVELDMAKVKQYEEESIYLPYLKEDDPKWFSSKPEY